MRELIDIFAPEKLHESEQPLRTEWYVLAWNGSGWNWSDAMTEEQARSEYARQVRATDVPSKLICAATVLEDAGDDATALNHPAK